MACKVQMFLVSSPEMPLKIHVVDKILFKYLFIDPPNRDADIESQRAAHLSPNGST